MTVAHLTLRVDREYLAYLMAKAALQTIIQGQQGDSKASKGTRSAIKERMPPTSPAKLSGV